MGASKANEITIVLFWTVV